MQNDQKPDEAPKYHPMFSFESDVVLCSRDGILFRVPSTTLRMTSSWFRAMFTLPQGANPSTSSSASPPVGLSPPVDSEVIALDEDARTLEPLLRMVCGLEIATLDTWD